MMVLLLVLWKVVQESIWPQWTEKVNTRVSNNTEIFQQISKVSIWSNFWLTFSPWTLHELSAKPWEWRDCLANVVIVLHRRFCWCYDLGSFQFYPPWRLESSNCFDHGQSTPLFFPWSNLSLYHTSTHSVYTLEISERRTRPRQSSTLQECTSRLG